MVTLKIEFQLDGQTTKLQANLKNDMTLSESKGNQATDIIEDNGDDQRWSLIFGDIENEDYTTIEAVMYRDCETGDPCPEVDYLILWDDTHDRMVDEVYPTAQQKKYR